MKPKNKIIRGAEEALAHAKGENNESRVTEGYKLPRLEDGGVDWEEISTTTSHEDFDRFSWGNGADEVELGAYEFFKLIDANARAEERERCARVAEKPVLVSGIPRATQRGLTIAQSIRNLGDET